MSLINLKSKDMYNEPINLWRTKQRVHYHHDVISKGNELVSDSNTQLQWHIYTVIKKYHKYSRVFILLNTFESLLI